VLTRLQKHVEPEAAAHNPHTHLRPERRIIYLKQWLAVDVPSHKLAGLPEETVASVAGEERVSDQPAAGGEGVGDV
jgi:hypothetical protein